MQKLNDLLLKGINALIHENLESLDDYRYGSFSPKYLVYKPWLSVDLPLFFTKNGEKLQSVVSNGYLSEFVEYRKEILEFDLSTKNPDQIFISVTELFDVVDREINKKGVNSWHSL